MQLAYAKEVADETAGESVRDVVVTVPGWFSQSERQAVLDAVELAGLRSIGLVNDGAAGESRSSFVRRQRRMEIHRASSLLSQRRSTTP
jgi:hypoxia up-regulated 1